MPTDTMNGVSIESKTETLVTPELLAKAFWNMDCEQQVAFFAALAIETKKSQEAAAKSKSFWHVGEYGEMQWCHLKDEIRKNPEAHKQYMALGIWAFDYFTGFDNEDR